MNRKLSSNDLNRPDLEAYKVMPRKQIRVILDNVRSMSNVGSVFRTSDAFSIEKLMLCGITGSPPHREIQKTALGSTDSVLWEHYESALKAIEECKSDGFTIVGVEQCEQTYSPSQLKYLGDKICLILGNEVDGVDQQAIDACDLIIEIPQLGTKHSLNVSVAAGIVIWEAFNASK